MGLLEVFTRHSHLRSNVLGIKHEKSTKQPVRMKYLTVLNKCIDLLTAEMTDFFFYTFPSIFAFFGLVQDAGDLKTLLSLIMSTKSVYSKWKYKN